MPIGGEGASSDRALSLHLPEKRLIACPPNPAFGTHEHRVAAGRTVLMVEHNMGVVAGLCDRITVLARGAVLAEGSYSEVSTNAAVLEAYMGGADASLAQAAH